VIPLTALPTLNATLNGLSALLLAGGFLCIRRRKVAAHRACMLSACITSALFLASYLVYHFQVGSVRFAGQGWVRPAYFTILFSHTVLAAAVVPLVLLTLGRALRGRFDRHARLARFTLPVWLYVSVTGVIIYMMLYHLFPPASPGAR
jgi:uncharacterized membrane protein YozB (DUF420 family)